ncbi:hypothetical protein HOT75_gp088 [Gordonia phage Daredevil]|uniref:Uncharacterized protein n=1 Tax=Gordonia phage Daredevil TaxID=2283286 RepID=A0A345MIU4_9CAUD|nr:hypothetical protein HOT75_gp088 [Gordonia phage Daredevil]AXH70475.1 hypothetical protein SEA_DAREDEVIL_88 [Gordonia phage Daredevil]
MANTKTCPATLNREVGDHTFKLDCAIDPDDHYEMAHTLANGITWHAGEERTAAMQVEALPKPDPNRRGGRQ